MSSERPQGLLEQPGLVAPVSSCATSRTVTPLPSAPVLEGLSTPEARGLACRPAIGIRDAFTRVRTSKACLVKAVPRAIDASAACNHRWLRVETDATLAADRRGRTRRCRCCLNALRCGQTSRHVGGCTKQPFDIIAKIAKCNIALQAEEPANRPRCVAVIGIEPFMGFRTARVRSLADCTFPALAFEQHPVLGISDSRCCLIASRGFALQAAEPVARAFALELFAADPTRSIFVDPIWEAPTNVCFGDHSTCFFRQRNSCRPWHIKESSGRKP